MSDEKLLPFTVYRRSIFNTPGDPRWCMGTVWDNRAGSSQCSRKPKHQYGGHGWCTQHHPPNEEKRKQERQARYDAEAERNRQEWAARDTERKLRDAALNAIRQIADGYNDPRGLAMEVLGRKPTEGI